MGQLTWTLPPDLWAGLGKIIVADIILAGDNAVVIALACRNLPPRYRNWAILGGTAGAIILRIIFCVIITWLLQIPYIRLIGGGLLLWIGVKLLSQGEGDAAVHAHDNLWAAIWTIIVADAVMSLDNAIAIAGAAKGAILLIAIGLMLSIPIIIMGAQILVKVLERFPMIVILGSALIGFIGGEVIATDPLIHDHVRPVLMSAADWYGHYAEETLGIAGAIFVVGLGMSLARRKRARGHPVAQARETTDS